MERLTKVINACGKTIIVYTQGKYEDTTAGEMEHEDIRNVMKRLSDYEDTGLTPEEITELKERDTAKVPNKKLRHRGGFETCHCPNDDLISRKALLDRFRYGDKESESDKAWICAVRRMIKEQTTAFDKEEVIEELEDYLFERYCVEGDEKIAEIIKKGGLN